MAIGLSDILSALKNLVQATSNLSVQNQTSTTVTSPTLILAGSGVLASFTVVVAGSTAGTISNASAVSGVTAANTLVTVPNTIGVYQCGLAYGIGLVVVPGAGQSINVTYSKVS